MPDGIFLRIFLIFSIFSVLPQCQSEEEGIYRFVYKNAPNSTKQSIVKTLFGGSKFFVQITCESSTPKASIRIYWTLAELPCFLLDQYRSVNMITSERTVAECAADGHIMLPPFIEPHRKAQNSTSKFPELTAPVAVQTKPILKSVDNSVYTTVIDNIYNFTLVIEPVNNVDFIAKATVRIPGPNGYLNAIDYPLLPFYGIMCFVYVMYGIVWLTVSFLQWRDLLRIQFWIGGVILLGMLEKAIFYAEKQSINSTGIAVPEAEIAAEIVSCSKRTLARMLVIIMSLGFGIVKPRLGPMLHRVVGVGALYFILAVVDSYLKVKNLNEQTDAALVSRIPVAVLDSGICWWIFTSLVQTTRTLRLRRNMVKLSLYRHFTNTLIFSVLVSVIFMLYSISTRTNWNCTPGWEYKWFDEAFWHILFSTLLLLIMLLWRPTNNNQRYAFTPLLDNPEDEDDDEEDQFVSDVYAVKKRGNSDVRIPLTKTSTTEEDDLRWVEENIPSSMADPALPVLDSDEEIINTKFEVSKMQ